LRNPFPELEQSTIVAGQMVGGRYSLQSQVDDSPDHWLAEDEVEDRLVLLRFLPTDLQQDPRAVDELRRQVDLCRELDHPHLAAVFDLVVDSEAPAFLVMEHDAGRSLAALQPEQPGQVFTWDWLAPRVAQVADALRYAHGRNAVHGAVRPENILVNRLGDAKLLNFGVSTVLANPLYSGQASQKQLVYQSPQILEGRSPTASDDVYALGITLYRALSGTTPFYGGELLAQIRSAPLVPLEARLRELKIANPIPIVISRFILAALSKNPEVRPADLRELSQVAATPEVAPTAAPAEGLDSAPDEVGLPEIMVETGTESVTVSSEAEPDEVWRMRLAVKRDRRRRMVMTLAATVVLLAVAAGAWFQFGRHGKLGAGKTRAAASTPPLQTAKAEVTKTQLSSKPAAPAPVVEKPADPEKGFEPLFNGRDLNGWTGDPRFWSVKDGVIVGLARSDTPLKLHTYLVSNQGLMGDFELRFSFRCIVFRYNEQPNAGVEYRAAKVNDAQMKGYQYEIVRDPKDLGAVMDDQGRRYLAGRGEKALARSEGGADVLKSLGQAAPSAAAAGAFQKDDWNEGVILAQGNHLVHRLNGIVIAEVVDENKPKAHLSGLLAFELYARNTNNPATLIQFKDIRLKKLGAGGPVAVAVSGLPPKPR
jgi:serine/threonine protein kinase